MWEIPKTILRKCKSFTFQRRLMRICSMPARMTLQKSTGTEKSRREREGRNTHGFLRKCQPPACPRNPVATKDRSERTQCQAKKMGIVEQVTRWKVASKTERRSSSFDVKSCSSCRPTNFATLPTANLGVTRTRWHRQYAVDLATKKVHQGGENGKDRACVAEQLEKTWRQWCHTST